MRISHEGISDIFRQACSQGFVEREDTVLHFISSNVLRQKLESVKKAFPSNSIHTVAIKANPLTEVLREISLLGFGLEAASFEEVVHAKNVDCSNIGWDSPAKTKSEIDEVMSRMPEVIINCDSLNEAAYCSALNSKNKLLLRINPQMAGTAHASMSVAGHHSKFGEPISNRDKIVDELTINESVSGLHVHTSSQTENFQELSASVRAVIDLAKEINQKRTIPLSIINIGGGFPVNYKGEVELDILAYSEILRNDCPELFNGTFQVITEFGRYYHAHAGFSVTQVAQVKNFEDHQVLICHAGADMFLREAYQPGQWPHNILLLDKSGMVKESEKVATDIAGPLCFGGDYIQKSIEFKSANAEDWVAISDTGANSIALWSKHCSRAFPKCILYDDNDMRIIRERDSIDRCLAFWS
ncbi:MAG: hypothetical protein R2813_02650 [Flavobacteriales bacterium]